MSSKKITIPLGFPTDLKNDRWNYTRLYQAGETGASATIDIVKEIWIDIQCTQPEPFKGGQYPVFHVFNYVDPSKMFIPGWSGCRVHDYKVPFINLDDALAVAEHHATMAIESKQWIRFEDMDPARRAALRQIHEVSRQIGASAVMVF